VADGGRLARRHAHRILVHHQLRCRAACLLQPCKGARFGLDGPGGGRGHGLVVLLVAIRASRPPLPPPALLRLVPASEPAASLPPSSTRGSRLAPSSSRSRASNDSSAHAASTPSRPRSSSGSPSPAPLSSSRSSLTSLPPASPPLAASAGRRTSAQMVQAKTWASSFVYHCFYIVVWPTPFEMLLLGRQPALKRKHGLPPAMNPRSTPQTTRLVMSTRSLGDRVTPATVRR